MKTSERWLWRKSLPWMLRSHALLERLWGLILSLCPILPCRPISFSSVSFPSLLPLALPPSVTERCSKKMLDLRHPSPSEPWANTSLCSLWTTDPWYSAVAAQGPLAMPGQQRVIFSKAVDLLLCCLHFKISQLLVICVSFVIHLLWWITGTSSAFAWFCFVVYNDEMITTML